MAKHFFLVIFHLLM